MQILRAPHDAQTSTNVPVRPGKRRASARFDHAINYAPSDEKPSALDGSVVSIIDHIIACAITAGASDVHLEPGRHGTTVRFRLDGILRKMFALPRELHRAAIGRLKVLAGLKSDETRRPQDGRIEPEDFPDVSLRISILPTIFGEKVTMRIMDEGSKSVSIDQLSFSERDKKTLLRNIEKPFGMIAVCGPTGSGKTTTIYALLNHLQQDGVNISTLEDPVEYAVPGVNQTQVNPAIDVTFASGLRALLRQDPDIIMIGEARDSETAVMAANAAMTGHLVLTTLHTNDAPSAVTRLLEMNVDDFVVGSTVNLIIAQRLVRVVCDDCAYDEPLDPLVVQKIRERQDILDVLTAEQPALLRSLNRQAFRRGAGCEACSGTGYRGRVGIYEFLEMTKSIHGLVLSRASAERIAMAARRDGFRPMVSDGIVKILEGTTTFEEVLRTTRNS